MIHTKKYTKSYFAKVILIHSSIYSDSVKFNQSKHKEYIYIYIFISENIVNT